ncbi:MAG TPA: M15 family metallopeptidase [Gemmatimonadales bacterium]|nr:M15 family metallopeptidase [Gemmatimonadales bacterium]
MAQRYVIARGDTMGKIAKRFYGDAALFELLGRYNGIRDPNLVAVGQTLEIPSRRELDGPAPPPAPPPAAPARVPTPAPAPAPAPAVPPTLAVPNGLDQVLATFGNIYEYVRDDGTLDPRWETEMLTRAPLPFPIPFSWEPTTVVTRLQCHVKLKDIFPAVFTAIRDKGLQSQVQAFGGCYNFRPKRTIDKLSAHCWGIAIDLNTRTNAQGTAGDMSPDVVAVFRTAGFKWGGDWSGKSKDPMHFQYCTGY